MTTAQTGTPSSPSPAARREAAALALMKRIQAGDEAALDEVIQLHWTGLVDYAERLLDSRDAAEDVAQETIVRLWSRRRKWKPSSSLAAFLYRIARNVALNRKRRLQLRAQWLRRRAKVPRRTAPTPAQILERNELEGAVRAAVAALPERRREVFILSRFHGMSYREIAGIMGISAQTVANQMSAALTELRGALEPLVDSGDTATVHSIERARVSAG